MFDDIANLFHRLRGRPRPAGALHLRQALPKKFYSKVGIIEDTSILSIIVLLSALISPLLLYWLIQKTGWGKFLFERPAWAHIPGTPGSRSVTL